MRTIKVGDRDVTVEEPSIYKTELIGDKLAAIGKDAPEVQIELAKFTARYEKENVVVLDRASALAQVPGRVRHLSEEDWKGSGNQVRLSRSPSATEQVLAILPTVFTKAREQALDIVAVLVAPNSSLEDEGKVESVLKTERRFLRHNAKPSELISLLSECTEVIKEVIEQHKDELGKLRSFWTSLNRTEEPQTEHEAALKEAEEVEKALGVSGGFPSSTDSLPDTDGDTQTSPIESPSATPSLS